MPERGASLGGLLLLLEIRPLRRRALESFDLNRGLRLAVFAGVALFFMALLYSVFRPVTAYLWTRPELGPLLSARVLDLAFGLLFLLLLFSSVLAFLGRLMFADDAAFFAASPMPPSRYFELRLAQAALSSAWMLPLLWFPYLWALSRAEHGGAAFVAWGALAPFPLVVLAAALGAGALCLLLRRLPAERLRAGLMGAALTAFLAGLLALRFVHLERLADPQEARSVAAYLAGLDSLKAPWWPGTWAGMAVSSARGAPGVAAAWWLLSVAAAAAAWAGVVKIFGPHAFELWSKGLEGGARAGGARRSRAFAGARARAAWKVLLERDALALWRAPGRRLQALLLAALVALLAFSLGRLPLGRDQALKDWLYLPASGAVQLLLVAVASRFAFTAASQDQAGSWLLYHAPVDARDHARAGAVLYGLLLLPLSLGLGAVVARVFTPPPAALALGAADFLVLPLSLACLNAGLGLAWAGPRPRGPEEALASPEGVLVMVLGVGLVAAQNLLLLLPLREAWRAGLMPFYRVHWTLLALDALLWAALQLFAALWPLRLAERRVEGRD